MTEVEYPRILLTTGAPVGVTGNFGLTMTSLFEEWPTSAIANLYVSSPATEERAFAQCVESGLEGVLGYRLARKLARGLTSPETMVMQRSRLSQGSPTEGLDSRTIVNPYSILRAYADLLPYRAPDQVWKWIDQYRPKIILSPLESIRVMRFCTAISKRCEISIVPFFADDWPTTLYEGSPLLSVPRAGVQRALRAVLAQTHSGMAGSPAMAAELQSRYQKPFSTFMRTIAVPSVCPEPKLHLSGSSETRMVYAGRLNCERWRALIDVGQALECEAASGRNIHLDVFCPEEDARLYGVRIAAMSRVSLRGTLLPSELSAKLPDYDILLHMESFDEPQKRYTRLSLSTKIPQYLAVGRPILMYGPADVSVTQYVRQSGGGLVVDRRGVPALAAALRQLSQSCALRTALAKTGWDTARRSHDAQSVRRALRTFLTSCAAQASPTSPRYAA